MNETSATVTILTFLILGITTIIILPSILKTRERLKAHETFRYLIDKGHPAPPEVLAGLVEQPRPRTPGERDLRSSVVWLAVAIGISALGSSIAWVADPEGSSWIIAPGIGAFPACIGLAYLILWRANRNQQRA